MPTLTVQVSAEFRARVIRAARQRKVTVSQLMRAAVEKELRVVETTRRGSASGRWRRFFKSHPPALVNGPMDLSSREGIDRLGSSTGASR